MPVISATSAAASRTSCPALYFSSLYSSGSTSINSFGGTIFPLFLGENVRVGMQHIHHDSGNGQCAEHNIEGAQGRLPPRGCVGDDNVLPRRSRP